MEGKEWKKKTVVPQATTVVKKVVAPATVMKKTVKPVDAEDELEDVAKKAEGKKKSAINAGTVAKVKGDLHKKKASASRIEAPVAIPTIINGVKNPIVTGKRLKQALAVAIAKVAHCEPETVWQAVANSGIAYKQVQTADQAKNADLLHNANFSGKPYGNWAIANVENYYKTNKAGVDQCMKFAEALVKAVKAGKLKK